MPRLLSHFLGWAVRFSVVAPMLNGAGIFPHASVIDQKIGPQIQPMAANAAKTTGAVHALFFWSSNCRPCQNMMQQELPALVERHGLLLKILYVDVNSHAGDTLFQEALQKFGMMQPDLPVILLEDTVLEGKQAAIEFAGVVDDYLERGGAAWPDLPGLEPWLEASPGLRPVEPGAVLCSECDLLATADAATAAAPKPDDRIGTETALQPSQTAVVKAVMFWMDGCPHCHHVIDNVLPPLQDKYGDQLQIHLIELKDDQDVNMLFAVAESMGISKESVGVPFLVIGEHALVGSNQIPAELPGLIESYLTGGGVNFPGIEILAPLLPSTADDSICPSSAPCDGETPGTPAPVGSSPPPPGESTSAATTSAEIPMRSNGFTLAILMMIAMAGALVYTGAAFVKSLQAASHKQSFPASEPNRSIRDWDFWLTPILIIAGLVVAAYLAYVETQQVSAVCGPVGDCNTVQSSSYARLFGVLPIGVLGVAGYLAFLAGWMMTFVRSRKLASLSRLTMFVLAYIGVVFSLYLTYLEPFVIKAVCIWCLTSALIMTLLLLLSLKPALQALSGVGFRNNMLDQMA